jgi:hypothetical protein
VSSPPSGTTDPSRPQAPDDLTSRAVDTRGRRLTLVTPDDWWRVPLAAETTERSLAQLVSRQFRGLDDQPILKRQTLGQLLATASRARENGGVELYLATGLVAGVPLSASLVVSIIEAPGGGGAGALARLWGQDGAETRTVSLPIGTAVRRRRVAVSPGAQSVGGDGEQVLVDFAIEIPGDDRWVLLSFSSPLVVLAEPMAELFEAVALTARWEDPA